MAAAVGDLVDPDHREPGEAADGSSPWTTRLTIEATDRQVTRNSRLITLKAVCWASQAATSSKSRVKRALGRAQPTASVTTRQPRPPQRNPQPALHETPGRAEIEVPPAANPAVITGGADTAAARTDKPPRAATHRRGDTVPIELHPVTINPADPEQLVECRTDAHLKR